MSTDNSPFSEMTVALDIDSDEFVEGIEEATRAVKDLNAELEYLHELEEKTYLSESAIRERFERRLRQATSNYNL